MSALVDNTEDEAAELAYGLLWHASVDRYTRAGRLTSDARLAIGNAIGVDRKRRGIERAKAFLAAHPLPARCG